MAPPNSPAAATAAAPPGGLSAAGFKALWFDLSEGIWGTVQGAFNEKASMTQILADAVIGMIPLVGDVTAVRDLIATVIHLVDDPERRQEVGDWVLLVVLVFALIPVFGGVIKGVGRITIKLTREAELLHGAARAEHLAAGARDIVAFLNRIGHCHAEAWFKSLRIADHEAQIVESFGRLIDTMNGAIVQFHRTVGKLMPAGLSARIEAVHGGLMAVKELAGSKIPLAVKDFDQQLREIQAYVHSGGETTSRKVVHQIAVGEGRVTRAEEARLIEDRALPARSARGWRPNKAVASEPKTYERVYQHAAGYPDLRSLTVKDHHVYIEAFSGRIVNRPLQEGDALYRMFGPDGLTHQTKVSSSFVAGAWWGLGPAPQNARMWREKAAVLDEFNRNGFMVTAIVLEGREVKAAVGTVAEQSGQKIPGQFLPGGATQAVLALEDVTKIELKKVADRVVATGKSEAWMDSGSGMKFEVAATNWQQANGRWGYLRMPGQPSLQVARVGAREYASKRSDEVEQ